MWAYLRVWSSAVCLYLRMQRAALCIVVCHLQFPEFYFFFYELRFASIFASDLNFQFCMSLDIYDFPFIEIIYDGISSFAWL